MKCMHRRAQAGDDGRLRQAQVTKRRQDVGKMWAYLDARDVLPARRDLAREVAVCE